MTVHNIICHSDDVTDISGKIKVELPFDIHTTHATFTGWFLEFSNDGLANIINPSNKDMVIQIPWLTWPNPYGSALSVDILQYPGILLGIDYNTYKDYRSGYNINQTFCVCNNVIPKSSFISFQFTNKVAWGYDVGAGQQTPWKIILKFEVEDAQIHGV